MFFKQDSAHMSTPGTIKLKKVDSYQFRRLDKRVHKVGHQSAHKIVIKISFLGKSIKTGPSCKRRPDRTYKDTTGLSLDHKSYFQ